MIQLYHLYYCKRNLALPPQEMKQLNFFWQLLGFRDFEGATIYQGLQLHLCQFTDLKIRRFQESSYYFATAITAMEISTYIKIHMNLSYNWVNLQVESKFSLTCDLGPRIQTSLLKHSSIKWKQILGSP